MFGLVREIICRCEEITREEIEEAIASGAVTVDEVKRVTRAGMGFCQGRTCWRLIASLIANRTGKPAGEVLPPRPRSPVRPLRVEEMARGALGDGVR